MNGWIKLHRCLLEKAVWQNHNIFRVWCWCLLKATHKPHEQMIGMKKILLQPGQFIYGREIGSIETKVRPSTLHDCMMWLKGNNSISINPTTKYSIITVTNWDLYQSEEIESDSKPTTKPTTARQQPDNNATTTQQQPDTNKNGKNEKNGKKGKNIVLTPFEQSLADFTEMRKKIKKPLTESAMNLILEKLDKIASDEQEKIMILNQSTMNCWQGVFPLKDDASSVKKTGNSFMDQLEKMAREAEDE